MSKSQLLVFGSILRAVNLISICLVSLFMTPFLIKSLGDRIYGIWMLIGSVFGFYDLLDLGLNSAVTRFLSGDLGRKDYDASNRVINTALTTFLIIGSIAFAVTVGVSFFSGLFIPDPVELVVFKKFMLITGVSVSLMFIMRTFNGVLGAHLRYDVTVFIDLLNLVLRTLFIIYFLRRGHGLVAIGMVMLLVNLFCHVLTIISVKHIAPYVHFSVKYFNWPQLKTFFSYSVYSFFGQLSTRISHDIDNFVIAGFLNVGFVTVYSLASRLLRYFTQLLWATMGLMTPVFSQYESTGNFAAIREKFTFVSKISWCASLIIGGNILLLGDNFILRWMGPEYNAAYPLLVILTIAGMVTSTNIPGINLVYGISRHRFATIASLCGAVVNLIISIVLVRSMGLKGVALGTAIPAVINGAIVMPIYICHVIQMRPRDYYLRMGLPILAFTGGFFLVIGPVTRLLMAPGYLNVLVCGLFNTVVYLLLIYYIIFNNSERRYLHAAIPSQRIKAFLDQRMPRTNY